jgi:hypothetical protein
MSELRAAIGLFLAFVFIIGGSVGVGIPLAMAIIWVLS